MKIFQEFSLNEKICTGMDSTFITSYPRKQIKKDIKVLSHYFWLLRSIYKIITKVLSPRLSEVLKDTTSHYQSPSMGGRQILDASLVLDEVMEHMHRQK